MAPLMPDLSGVTPPSPAAEPVRDKDGRRPPARGQRRAAAPRAETKEAAPLAEPSGDAVPERHLDMLV